MSDRTNQKKEKKEPVTLDVIEARRRREMQFQSEEEKRSWEIAYRKSKWYTPYFLVGVGINFLLYKSGLDLATNMLWGMIVGVGVPLITMFLFTEIHYRLFIARTIKQ